MSSNEVPAGPGPLRARARRVLDERDRKLDDAGRDLDRECRRQLAALRKRCPHLFEHDEPLRPGTQGPDVPLDPPQATQLLRLAARAGSTPTQLWQRAGHELLVGVGALDIETSHGSALVTIPIRCDQTKDDRVQVAFALGSAKRPAGMLVATETRPRGPAEVIDVWADELVALAWRSLLDMTSALAAEAGRDGDGAGLVPLGIEASTNGLVLHTMSRHAFDRIRR